MPPEYHETHPIPWTWRLGPPAAGLVVAVAVYAAIWGLSKITRERPLDPWWGMLSFVLVTAWMPWLVLGLGRRKWTLHVSGGRLRYEYGWLRGSIDIADVETVSAETIADKKSGRRDRSRGAEAARVVARPGSGVRIRTVSKRGFVQEWVVPTDDPEAVARALGKELLPAPPV
jgi:hypothetical protein